MFISAATGAGIDVLLDAVVAGLDARTVELQLEIPYGRGDILADVHNTGDVVDVDHLATASHVTVKLPHEEANRFRTYVKS